MNDIAHTRNDIKYSLNNVLIVAENLLIKIRIFKDDTKSPNLLSDTIRSSSKTRTILISNSKISQLFFSYLINFDGHTNFKISR
jgi:hypothetical protein